MDDNIIEIDISIKDLVEFNPAIGTESCHLFGTMGSGKSNFGFGIILTALLDRDEFCIMPGDVAVEWRHFPMHPRYKESNLSLTVIIPKDVDIFYYPEEFVREKERNDWFVEVDYETLDVFKYLSKDKPLLVIYDQHLNISDRAKFWARVLETVTRREVEVLRAINFLMHEAGIVFTEYARSKHWQHIKDFSEMFVETRKMGVRIFFISQLETELEYTLRRKCNFKIIKKSYLRTEYAKPIRASAPFLNVNEYILSYSGMYRLDNTFDETTEYKTIWKMVPPVGLKNSKSENKSRSHGESMKTLAEKRMDGELLEIDQICSDLRHKHKISYAELERLFGIPHSTLYQRIMKLNNIE